MGPAGRGIFVSYAREDEPYRKRLHVHLTPAVRGREIRYWDDRAIAPGAAWAAEIQQAIQQSSIAILLVSADFFASTYIQDVEVPAVLEARAEGRLAVIPVIVGPSGYTSDPRLGGLQAFNDPAAPLSGLPAPQQEVLWSGLAEYVRGVGGVLSLGRSANIIDVLDPQIEHVRAGTADAGAPVRHSVTVAAEQSPREPVLVGRVRGESRTRITAAELAQRLSPEDLDHVHTLETSMERWYADWKALYAGRGTNLGDDETLKAAVRRMRHDLVQVLDFLQQLGFDLQDHYSRIRNAITSI